MGRVGPRSQDRAGPMRRGHSMGNLVPLRARATEQETCLSSGTCSSRPCCHVKSCTSIANSADFSKDVGNKDKREKLLIFKRWHLI